MDLVPSVAVSGGVQPQKGQFMDGFALVCTISKCAPVERVFGWS